jgi:hypothetical protein
MISKDLPQDLQWKSGITSDMCSVWSMDVCCSMCTLVLLQSSVALDWIVSTTIKYRNKARTCISSCDEAWLGIFFWKEGLIENFDAVPLSTDLLRGFCSQPSDPLVFVVFGSFTVRVRKENTLKRWTMFTHCLPWNHFSSWCFHFWIKLSLRQL